jgi:hypothetical protein
MVPLHGQLISELSTIVPNKKHTIMNTVEHFIDRIENCNLSISEMTDLKNYLEDKIQADTLDKLYKVKMERLGDGWEYDFNGLNFEAQLHAFQGRRWRVYRRVRGGKNADRLVRGEVVVKEWIGGPYDIRKAIALGGIK